MGIKCNEDHFCAPIIIPTLNRITHLKRCITSLAASPLAKYTALFVSVDYPPEEKYLDGYEDVKKYVKAIEGFKKVYWYIQPENLGPQNNSRFLRNRIKEKGFNTYIFTEDDNEFSPALLGYLNDGLQKYKNDEKVYAICSGIRRVHWKYTELSNVFLLPDKSPYGYATWVEKHERLSNMICQEYFDQIGRKPKTLFRMYQVNNDAFFYYSRDILRQVPAMRDREGNLATMDMTTAILSATKGNIWFLYPNVIMRRNWGYDGSGVNCGIVDEDVSKNELYKDNCFEAYGSTDYYQLYLKTWGERRKTKMPIKEVIKSILIISGNCIYLNIRELFVFLKVVNKIK